MLLCSDSFTFPLMDGSLRIASLFLSQILHQMKLTRVFPFFCVILKPIISDFPYSIKVCSSTWFPVGSMTGMSLLDTNEVIQTKQLMKFWLQRRVSIDIKSEKADFYFIWWKLNQSMESSADQASYAVLHDFDSTLKICLHGFLSSLLYSKFLCGKPFWWQVYLIYELGI